MESREVSESLRLLIFYKDVQKKLGIPVKIIGDTRWTVSRGVNILSLTVSYT